ncbi:sensor histidine kinase [Streptantibioticus ferralitis]|uniref:histidine kinase n=1 Tax=Streptantibioticus ferralitis TaxID=236510 RepID=A0ABT5Z191_9ACTN|nr:HAMP domain-containing sensor histidine kinase [Streptantibioticus ferralitis]MDF2257564.1 HAMP domain-containing sensor histidine kinase [Streptantibioticus ferralitis]
MTAAYTVITVIGLAALSGLVIRTDSRSWRSSEYDEMRRRANVVTSLIYYDHDRVQLDGLYDDEATAGNPQVSVLLKQGRDPAAFRQVFASRQGRFPVSLARLAQPASTAATADDTVISAGADDTGHLVYFLAAPFYVDGTQQVAGAVVVIGDPAHGAAEHHRLVLTLLAGCATLTALGGATGYLLSGRSMRPALLSLEQQERLLADAAHELRTPVAVMRGAVDVAEATPSALAVHLPRIRRASDRMSDVIENLLVRGRLQAGVDAVRREPVRLDQLVEAVCEDFPPGDHRIRLDAQESAACVDPSLVRLAVRNLLDNAARHGATPTGPGAGWADITVMVRGAEISVADRGPGIDPADLPALFARFHSPSGGTGIGLSLVQWVADAHRGSVQARRLPDGGTVFVLRLARPQRSERRPRPHRAR